MAKETFVHKYGEWAFVTGASSGIGKDFALELARTGFNLYLVARREDELSKLKKEIEEVYKVAVTYRAFDLSSTENVNTLITETKDINIGLIVLAAGFGSGGKFTELSLETELNQIDLNCRSVVQLTHHFANRFKLKQKGGIILFGSLVGFQGVAWASTYSATKAFIQSFAEGLYDEFKLIGIDILSVAPGPVNSGFGERAHMSMGLSQSPKGIAKFSLVCLGKKPTVRPGFLSKFLGYSLIVLPKRLRSLILKQIMSDMVFKKK
ncbi:SDR family NAD(P)-dependent oxidoreductase [Leptospira stimsonii]|uniref:Short-chain dehydrogenase n=1 Tax=Leptospira stimsonii TaxID=2202203 RepID=A0A396YT35_9LEPT|nr:SDR family NAD(P)-dependent oxidoreductase [Leptospira stimsonii]RHX85735.1 short-chain dehydrogenase [Leptospira stimsonii]